METFAFKPVIL